MLSKVRLWIRKRIMKKTAIVVIALGLVAFGLLYLLRGNPKLTNIQDWLNNNGLATLFAVIVPIWIYFIVYLWNKRKEETSEYIKHEDLLLGEIRKLENVQAIHYRESSLINWWKHNYDKLSFHSWEAEFNGDSIIIKSALENSDIRVYLEKHLVRSKLQALLNDWESAMKKDLLARKFLFDSITNKVKESIGITIVQYTFGKEYVKPYITDYYGAVIYDAIFCELAGNPIRDTKAYLKCEAQGNISWNYGGTNWLLLSIDDKKQQDCAIDLLLKLERDLINLPEAQEAKKLYFEAINKTQQLKEMVKITTSLPRGKRCDYCKRL